jgi:hypothetical protein
MDSQDTHNIYKLYKEGFFRKKPDGWDTPRRSSPEYDRQIRVKISDGSLFFSEQDMIENSENIKKIYDGIGRRNITYNIYKTNHSEGDVYVPFIVMHITDYPDSRKMILSQYSIKGYEIEEHAMNDLSKMIQRGDGRRSIGLRPGEDYADY